MKSYNKLGSKFLQKVGAKGCLRRFKDMLRCFAVESTQHKKVEHAHQFKQHHSSKLRLTSQHEKVKSLQFSLQN